MAYLIGADEAGYGPHLGPLVVSTTVWHVADEPGSVDLYKRLKGVISDSARDATKIAIADSKLLYKSKDLRLLERGVLTALAVAGAPVLDWQQLWDALGADPEGLRRREPWFSKFERPLPWSIDRDELNTLVEQMRAGLEAADVRLLAVRSRAVLPGEFNVLVRRYDNKAEALSNVTLDLLADSIAELGDEPILAICDKHGGRNRYQALLQSRFPECLVEVRGESRAESVYRFGPETRRVEVRFRVGGEEFLPAALASMACKYLREVAMEAFNEYWRGHVPELRPTAGYYTDAWRFREEIGAKQKQLGIQDGVLWRER